MAYKLNFSPHGKKAKSIVILVIQPATPLWKYQDGGTECLSKALSQGGFNQFSYLLIRLRWSTSLAQIAAAAESFLQFTSRWRQEPLLIECFNNVIKNILWAIFHSKGLLARFQFRKEPSTTELLIKFFSAPAISVIFMFKVTNGIVITNSMIIPRV